MSTAEQVPDFAVSDLYPEPTLNLDLILHEAEALRTWLLKSEADGITALEEPVVNSVLTKLGRAVDVSRATVNVRYELEQAGLDIAHLSDEQVRELGRRVSEVALPSIRG